MSCVRSGLRAVFAGGICAAICFAATPAPADEDDEQIESLEQGLVATYRTLAPGSGDATLARIDAKPAFALGNSSPHPRIPPSPFEVVWKGRLDQSVPDQVRFGAYVAGDVSVVVHGVIVLQGRGDAETAWVDAKQSLELPFGSYPVEITYRSLPEVPARLQLWWSGTAFSWEPLPAWRFKHAGNQVSVAVRRDDLATRGRQIAGQLGCARCHRTAMPSADETPPGPRSPAWIAECVGRGCFNGWQTRHRFVRAHTCQPCSHTTDKGWWNDRSWQIIYFVPTTQRERPS